jgi:phage gp36-like protein
MYCAEQDLIDRYGQLELIQRTDSTGSGVMDSQVISRAIADAAAEIDGYLTQYDLPLTAVPEVLVRVACDMARYYLYATIDLEPTSVVRVRYSSAIDFLNKVAKGAVKLGVDSNQVAPIEQTVVVMASNTKLFGRPS